MPHAQQALGFAREHGYQLLEADALAVVAAILRDLGDTARAARAAG